MSTEKGHRDAVLLALNVERGGLETKNVESIRSWKRLRNGFSKKEHSPAFNPTRPTLDFSYRTLR